VEITLDRALAIAGIVAAIVLVVLDKAGKLRGPALLVLLGVAALMTLPLGLGNSWIKDTPWGMLKFSKMTLIVSIVAVCYSACAVWISQPTHTEEEQVVKQPQEPESLPPVPPKLIAEGKSEIVARVYMRGMFPQPPATKAEFSPILQEFFYDWVLTLVPEGRTGDILITLKEPTKNNDSIKIAPDIATVSGPIAKWMSGFQEPARKNPDFYEITIRFPDGLDKDRPARIVFRRPLKLKDKTTLSPSDFSRSMDIHAAKVEVVKKYYEETKQFELISLQLKTLMAWKYSGKDSSPLLIRRNPNAPLPPLGRGEIETTLEVRCEDAACQKIIVKQMEARKKDL
jgi:hypothetical protein